MKKVLYLFIILFVFGSPARFFSIENTHPVSLNTISKTEKKISASNIKTVDSDSSDSKSDSHLKRNKKGLIPEFYCIVSTKFHDDPKFFEPPPILLKNQLYYFFTFSSNEKRGPPFFSFYII